jgi:LysR family transcriptional regulator for bpeEF and oprC
MDQMFCMRVYTRVVEHGAFARAADDLGVSPPTVTAAVAHLEQHLGTRLLHRTTRRLSLTDEGRRYYESCVRILGDLAAAEEDLCGDRRSPRGRLRVSVPQAFTHLLFFPALPDFLARYPELSLDVVVTDRAVNLVEEGIDCAVRAVALPDDSTLVARRVGAGMRITCAAPAYLAARGTPRCEADLAGHECVAFVSPSSGRTQDWLFARDGGQTCYTPAGRLRVTSLEAAAAAAMAGIGVAQVPEPLILPALDSGALQPLLLDCVAPAPSMMVVYPGNRYLSAKVRVFADFVADLYPAEGWWPQLVTRVGPLARSTAATDDAS